MKRIRKTKYFDQDGRLISIPEVFGYDDFLRELLKLREANVEFEIRERAAWDADGQCILKWTSPRNTGKGDFTPFSVRANSDTREWFENVSNKTGMSKSEVLEWLIAHSTIPTIDTIGARDAFRLTRCADCGRQCSDAMMRNCGDFGKYVRDWAKREQTKQQ